eukprot:6209200-Pleurochrysis_carterae.AAC.5
MQLLYMLARILGAEDTEHAAGRRGRCATKRAQSKLCSARIGKMHPFAVAAISSSAPFKSMQIELERKSGNVLKFRTNECTLVEM